MVLTRRYNKLDQGWEVRLEITYEEFNGKYNCCEWVKLPEGASKD